MMHFTLSNCSTVIHLLHLQCNVQLMRSASVTAEPLVCAVGNNVVCLSALHLFVPNDLVQFHSL